MKKLIPGASALASVLLLCLSCFSGSRVYAVTPASVHSSADSVQTVAGTFDRDGDGLPDDLEIRLGTDSWLADTDGDGVSDKIEIGPNPDKPLNSDNDRYLDALDVDDDGDGIPTILELNGDTDGDGIPDYLDTDSDGDSKPDALEAGLSGKDTDHDGVDDYFDVDQTGREDTNGDGVDGHQMLLDSDRDDIPDVRDADDNDGPAGDPDQDGLSNEEENKAGSNPANPDTDGDGVPDAAELGDANAPRDTDGDGIPDILDTDDDGDGLDTARETAEDSARPQELDTDGDGLPNYLDTDDDGDGAPTASEDMNRNGQFADDDSDQDGIPDYLDKNDTDGSKGKEGFRQELVPSASVSGDSDGDGIEDELEMGLSPDNPADTDNDGIYDYLDEDDDGDGIPTRLEGEADRDGDGRVNYLDVDESGYFYCAKNGHIVAGIRKFKIVPEKDVVLFSAAKDGRYRWEPKKPGTYSLQFVLPKGMRTLTDREKGDLYVTEANGPVLNLGMSEDISRESYLSGFNPDKLPVWYSAFVIQEKAPPMINHNIPLIGGECDEIKD